METLTKQFESRVAGCLKRIGLKPSMVAVYGRWAISTRCVGSFLAAPRRLAMACQVPVFIEACRRAHVAPVPSRGNAPRNSSPNRTEADR